MLIYFLVKFVLGGAIDNKQPLVQIMALHRTGDKPLSEPLMAYLTDIYVLLSLNELNAMMLHDDSPYLQNFYGEILVWIHI